MQRDVVFIQATFRLNHLSNAISMKRNWKFAIDLTNDDDDDDGFAIYTDALSLRMYNFYCFHPI